MSEADKKEIQAKWDAHLAGLTRLERVIEKTIEDAGVCFYTRCQLRESMHKDLVEYVAGYDSEHALKEEFKKKDMQRYNDSMGLDTR